MFEIMWQLDWVSLTVVVWSYGINSFGGGGVWLWWRRRCWWRWWWWWLVISLSGRNSSSVVMVLYCYGSVSCVLSTVRWRSSTIRQSGSRSLSSSRVVGPELRLTGCRDTSTTQSEFYLLLARPGFKQTRMESCLSRFYKYWEFLVVLTLSQ